MRTTKAQRTRTGQRHSNHIKPNPEQRKTISFSETEDDERAGSSGWMTFGGWAGSKRFKERRSQDEVETTEGYNTRAISPKAKRNANQALARLTRNKKCMANIHFRSDPHETGPALPSCFVPD